MKKHQKDISEIDQKIISMYARGLTTRQISEQIEEIYSFECSEDLNSTYKKLNRQRSVFPSDKALLKALYLSTLQATKKWYLPLRNWGKVYGEFAVMYEGRIPS